MPSLIEPGTKYFFSETLKNVNIERNRTNTLLFNFSLLIMFIIIVYGILSFRKKNKPSIDEVKKNEILKKDYLLNKVKILQEKSKKEYDTMITKLPQFESDFELLHKNFYNT
jgi:hypothetical protein|uniref:Uncharacterized protein n=1 Tax=viral metagenome TaxID=1070528 RepID=A0A6C0IPX6_9ZZZZ